VRGLSGVQRSIGAYLGELLDGLPSEYLLNPRLSPYFTG
jgi:hypothetical protein